jgi:ribulose-5-phosphate 4-epimerase/fuculose-1-phosphate aldolase
MPTVLLIDDTAAPVFSAPDVGVRANRRDLVLTDAEGLQSWLASSAVGAAVVVVPIRPDPGIRPLQLLADKRPDVLRVGVFVDEQPSAIRASAALVHRAFPGSDAVAAIEDAVEQGERFRALLTDRRLAAVVGRLRRLPTVPALYRRLMRECQSDHASARTIGELVAEEPSVAARVLQAANSPYYGRRGHVMDPTQAVHRIGVEGVKALVLTSHLLAEFSETERQRFDLYGLWRHSLIASSFARIILQDVATSHADLETAAAALLHDILDTDGKILSGQGTPNTEFWIHARIYAARPDVAGVVHAHPPACICLTQIGEPHRIVHNAGGVFRQGVPEYERIGLIRSRELGDLLATTLGDGIAVMMRGHGISTALPDVRTATVAACLLEESAELQLRMLATAGGDASRLRVYTREEAERVGDQLAGGPLARAWEYYSTAAEQRPLGG